MYINYNNKKTKMKQEQRNRLLEERNNLDTDFVSEKSKIINIKILELNELNNARNIGIYYPKDCEVDTKELIKKLIENGKNVFLPKVIKNHNKDIDNDEMEFKEIKNFEELVYGEYGIKEPSENSRKINAEEIDVLIMPCVGVDTKGNRIGRGKGYYDKYLESVSKAKKICVAYDFQIIDNEIEKEAHDKKVDIIITESKIITTDEIINSNAFKLLDGKKLADQINEKVKQEINSYSNKELIKVPKLVAIIVGEDPASKLYVRIKGEKCKEVGINFEKLSYSEEMDENELINEIEKLNNEKEVTGIMIQLPLPKHLDKEKIINKISVKKDIDGLTQENRILLSQGDESLACCAPKGIMRLLDENNIELKGKNIVVLGKGYLVGYPFILMLKNRNLDFTVCDCNTQNIQEFTRKADILITATGNAHLIKSNDIKEGVVIIDAGCAKVGGCVVGDVDFEDVKNKSSYITPIIGGVGPVTVAILMENILTAHKNSFIRETKEINETNQRNEEDD